MAYEPSPPPVKKGRHLYKHGMLQHPLYSTWRGMMQRCSDPASKSYPHYGGKGVEVCEQWKDFPRFLADMGTPEPGQMLERIDGTQGYQPSNCKWASRSEQMKNRSNSVHIKYGDKTMNLVDWARAIGINRSTLKYRLANWPIEKALSFNKFRTNGEPV
jgi:hypothetical protein